MLFLLELFGVMVLILVYMYLKTQYYVKPYGGVLPEIKVPFYSIFGIFRMLPSQSTMKKLSLPKTSYIQQVFSGGAVLFPKEKAVTSRIGLQTLIILKKAESVEAVRLRKKKKKLRKEQSTGTKEIERDFRDLLLDFVANYPDTTDEELRDELLSFLFASQDTTEATLSWALYLIGLHPEIQRKIHEELDSILGVDHKREITAEDLKQMFYLDRVLKECQRLYPSVPFNPRYMLEECTLCDCKIRKGSVVIIDTYDLHRDPDVFSNPEVFDPDRFLPANCAGRSPYAYIPFSKGSRSCIGKQFATMAVKTVVANTLHTFSLNSLEPRDKVHTAPGITLRSTKPLKVKFILRHTSDVTKSTIRM